MPQTIYLDANATNHVLPEAIEAATRAMSIQYGNPSSTHTEGIVAKTILEQSRRTAAEVIGAGEGNVIFTSGATESIQSAVLSALCAIRQRQDAGKSTGKILVYGATEHKAVPQALAHWNHILDLRLELRPLPVGRNGQHDLQTLAEWLSDTALLCIMAANNETGVVSDLSGIDRVLDAAPRRPLWLVDCVQALGKMELDLQRLRIDYAAFSGHKLYAPKGIGMLYVRKGSPFTPLMAGGGQEDGLRSGTENMPGIAALGAVLKALQEGKTFNSDRKMRGFRDQLEKALRIAFPSVEFNAPLSLTLPTTLNFSIPGMSRKAILNVFDAAGLRVSTGSACSAASSTPSHVLRSMGLPERQSEASIRLSFGPLSSAELIHAASLAIERCGKALTPTEDAAVDFTPAIPVTETTYAADPSTFTIQWNELDAYLQQHPTARLVDLREQAEHRASGGIHYGAWTELNAPMSELRTETPAWVVSDKTPVVLVCRSGYRSLKVAQWLHGKGYTEVRHLGGGLAMRPQGL